MIYLRIPAVNVQVLWVTGVATDGHRVFVIGGKAFANPNSGFEKKQLLLADIFELHMEETHCWIQVCQLQSSSDPCNPFSSLPHRVIGPLAVIHAESLDLSSVFLHLGSLFAVTNTAWC